MRERSSVPSLTLCVSVTVLLDLRRVGGSGGGFLCRTGLNSVRFGTFVAFDLGACLEVASACEGVFDAVDGLGGKRRWPGVVQAALISARALSMLSRRISTTSGTLHPKGLAPASARST